MNNAPTLHEFAALVSASGSLGAAEQSRLLDQAENDIALERATNALKTLADCLDEHAWVEELHFRWRFSNLSDATASPLRIEAMVGARSLHNEYGHGPVPSSMAIIESAALASRLSEGTLLAGDTSSSKLSQDDMRAAIQLGLRNTGFSGKAAIRLLATLKQAERELGKAFAWASINGPDWIPPAGLRGAAWERKAPRGPAEGIASALLFPVLAAEVERREIGLSATPAPSAGPRKTL